MTFTAAFWTLSSEFWSFSVRLLCLLLALLAGLALQSKHYIVSITSSVAFCYEVLLLAHGITESVEREEREQSSAPLYKYFLLDP